MRRITLQEVKDIIFIHQYRKSLPESYRPYFDWWVWEVSHGTIKVHYPNPPDYIHGRVLEDEIHSFTGNEELYT